MRQPILCLAGALWLTGCSAPAPVEEATPAVWELTSPGGERGWMMGTIHALPAGVDWRSDAVEEALADADVLVVEIANLGDPSTAATLADLSETPGQPPLTQRVDRGERRDLEALLADAGMADADFSRMESWAAALTLSAAVREGDAANGVDRALLAEADEVIALETVAGQLGLFDRLSGPAQSDLLAGVARDHRRGTGDAARRAWMAGDADRVAALAREGLLGNAELRRVLLTARNEDWAPRIAELVDAGREPFVAVGAGHVAGDGGLADLLADRGYTVRRIR